jgi:hypothetical protein
VVQVVFSRLLYVLGRSKNKKEQPDSGSTVVATTRTITRPHRLRAPETKDIE